MASGVMVVGVGQATRLLGMLTLDTKSYVADISFGVETNTDDAEGEAVRTVPIAADLRIPGIDGFEMIRRLRENALSSDVAIVVVSALGAKEIAAAGGLPPDVTVYRKPIPFQELHGYVQALIAQRRRQRSAG